jgi:hypothetical protein
MMERLSNSYAYHTSIVSKGTELLDSGDQAIFSTVHPRVILLVQWALQGANPSSNYHCFPN